MFSLLPLVLRGSIDSVGSAEFMTSARALPYSGKPPPGVAVAKLMLVLGAGFEMGLSPFCAAALAAIETVAMQSSRAIFISSLEGDDQWSRRLSGRPRGCRQAPDFMKACLSRTRTKVREHNDCITARRPFQPALPFQPHSRHHALL